jgi:hypothetical protein
MIQRLLSILLFTFAFISLNAANIDLQTARRAADGFLKTLNTGNTNRGLLPSSDFIISQNGIPVYYVFNLQPSGFVLVSAHDAAPPILGYSFENNYLTEAQPENFSLWMKGYAEMISYLNENSIASTEGNKALWDVYINKTSYKKNTTTTTVGPLIPCLWNQGSPYNYLCPADPSGSGGHVYSGCVATAMSQVMYYWRFPLQGAGTHGYTWDPYGYLYADFGNTSYKWEEMNNGTSVENFEMAQLQLQLGISVDMMYSGSGSGAYSEDAADALKTYFGYDESLELVYRDNYSYEDWKTLLRDQLDLSQPMYYHGFGTGGHAFNVDGYQDTAFFHFNWGWGGSYNGYFHLFNLNPGGNSFTQGQGAIINFIPGTASTIECGQTDTLTKFVGSIEDGSGPVSPYFNNSACNWLILPGDTLENIKLSFDRFDLEDGKDFLYVYDGLNAEAQLIGSYTGSSIPPEAVASSGAMFIKFETDGNGTSNGWLATYNAKQARFCSSNVTYINERSGSLSDGSGDFNYRDKSVCRYKLEPADAKSISITFNEFNTAGEGDYLEIYNLEDQTLLYRFFGQTNPGTLNFNTGKLYLVFVTDQQNSAPGWDFSFTSSGLTGIDEKNTESTISVFPNPANNQIQVTLNGMSGYSFKLISADGVEVYKENSCQSNVMYRIDISSFPRGIYILHIESEKGIINRKVVLN